MLWSEKIIKEKYMNLRSTCFFGVGMQLGNSYANNSKYGEYRMHFAMHKQQTTQTCRQIPSIGDEDIHAREKPNQSF